MVSVGEMEPFTGGDVRHYEDIGYAVNDFEARARVKIRDAVAKAYPGKALGEVVMEGLTLWHGSVWIDFKGFTLGD